MSPVWAPTRLSLILAIYPQGLASASRILRPRPCAPNGSRCRRCGRSPTRNGRRARRPRFRCFRAGRAFGQRRKGGAGARRMASRRQRALHGALPAPGKMLPGPAAAALLGGLVVSTPLGLSRPVGPTRGTSDDHDGGGGPAPDQSCGSLTERTHAMHPLDTGETGRSSQRQPRRTPEGRPSRSALIISIATPSSPFPFIHRHAQPWRRQWSRSWCVHDDDLTKRAQLA